MLNKKKKKKKNIAYFYANNSNKKRVILRNVTKRKFFSRGEREREKISMLLHILLWNWLTLITINK